jgi:hypothetical protein
VTLAVGKSLASDPINGRFQPDRCNDVMQWSSIADVLVDVANGRDGQSELLSQFANGVEAARTVLREVM